MTWTAGTWHLITLTYSGSQLQMYWDGVLNKTLAATGSVYADTGASYLGMAVVGSNYFNGSLDELKVFDYALSGVDVAALFANP